MSNQPNPSSAHSHAPIYQIRLQGHLGPEWSDWFDGLRIVHMEDGETLLIGPVVDQAALHGILRTIRNLALPILALKRLDGQEEETSGE